MDTLKAIKEQVKEIRKLSNKYSFEHIITHIERAEFYYLKGIEKKDENFFTDVVYRTNQAFEGSLRQSYIVLANKTESQTKSKKTFDIEEYFNSNSIFNDRVLKLFENYRKEWRNESSHNHKLFFNQSEAFLAVINVSSYVYVLLNQIIEKLAFLKQQEELKEQKEKKKAIAEIFNNKEFSLRDKIVELIKEISVDNSQLSYETKEVEIIGMLNAFLESAASDITVNTQYKIELNGNSYRPDIYIEYKKEKIIIEIKKALSSDMSHEDQLIEYLKAAGIEDGILWYPESVPGKNFLNVYDHSYFQTEMHYITKISTFWDE